MFACPAVFLLAVFFDNSGKSPRMRMRPRIQIENGIFIYPNATHNFILKNLSSLAHKLNLFPVIGI